MCDYYISYDKIIKLQISNKYLLESLCYCRGLYNYSNPELSFSGFLKQVHSWRESNASLFNVTNTKRAFIQRRIQLKGAPKGVIVNVNGQKIYSGTDMSTLPQPGQGPTGNKAINLHINLSKKPSLESTPQRKQQPMIIAAVRPQPPVRPILISVPQQTQPLPPQPVVMPAPPPILQVPAPQPPPQPDKEENELGNILTLALLNGLGKKEESPPQVIPVPVPVPAIRNQGYPSQNQGYPAGGSPNQGYPAGGSPNQGYPAGGSPNQGYPAGGSQNQGYPAGGGQNLQGAPPNAANGGTGAAASPLAGLSGILPLVLPMKCRCGCERRCPDLCGLCKDVDEEIYDTLECCKSVPCPCLNVGAATTTQQGMVTQPAAVTPQQGTGVAVPQNQPVSTLPATPPISGQGQPSQMSSPPLQPPVQTPPQPLSAPPLPSTPQLNPVPLVSAPPLPPLTPGSVVPPPVPQPSATGQATASGALSPLPPLPQIAPPQPGATPEKPKTSLPTTGLTPSQPVSGSIQPPKPQILPTVTNPSPKEEPVPSLPSGPVDGGSPKGSSSSTAPPPDNQGPIKIPQLPVLPGETENKRER